MRLVFTATAQDRQSGQKGPWKPEIREVPDGCIISKVETVHPHSLNDLSVTVRIHLTPSDGSDPIVETFKNDAFFYAVIATEARLEQ